MRRLHHFVLSPFCRKVRLVLGEKKLTFELVAERPWEKRPEFVALNPLALADQLFFTEVSGPLLREKVLKRFGWAHGQDASPDIAAIRSALEALRRHLAFFGDLAEKRGWLAGSLSLADFAVAAHISCLDYLGDLPWENVPQLREWYARTKSRPAFRPLLTDHLPGMPPPRHYANLDF
jgi:glutathione S-transferase